MCWQLDLYFSSCSCSCCCSGIGGSGSEGCGKGDLKINELMIAYIDGNYISITT